jgi:hypothetical protein
MNYESACHYLDLNRNGEITRELLKRQYRLKALCYHPDKNKDPDAAEQFRKIQESYEFLSADLLFCETGDSEGEDDVLGEETDPFGCERVSGYHAILSSFISRFMGQDMNPIMKLILQKIAGKCEDAAIEFMGKLDKQLLVKINGILKKYRAVFHLSAGFFDKIDELCSEKIRHDECIILNPLLGDLYENLVYRLKVGQAEYLVPLWHHELVYDNSGSDVYVKCYPVLPENISIDHQNNVIVQLKYRISDLWGLEKVSVEICDKKTVSFSPSELRFVAKQTLLFPKEGIAKMNTADVFNVARLSDVILHIEMEP